MMSLIWIFPSDDYDSLGGLIIEHLDLFPRQEMRSHRRSIRLVVEKLDKNRIELVHMYLPEKTETDSEEK